MKAAAMGKAVDWKQVWQIEQEQIRRMDQEQVWRMDREQVRQMDREQVRLLRRRIRQNRAEARREQVRQKNEPPRLSRAEEWLNALSHGTGALLAALCTALLLLKSDTPWKIAASLVYGASMVLMMLMSSIYHAMPTGSEAKRVCRRLDYTSIYLLIGGTFAPLLLVYMGGALGLRLFIAQWCVIAAGVALVLARGPGHWRGLLYTLYFLLGWSGLAFVPEFYRNAPTLLWFIFMGGVVYTAGMIPFVRKRKYDHCVWHVFVLVAAALHWAGIYSQVY